MSASIIEVGGIRTEIQQWGEEVGPLTILCHSAGTRGSSLADLAAALLARERGRIVAPDLRGHGASGADASDISLDAFAADVCEVAERFGDDRGVRLLGTSLGGVVAGMAAARQPSLFSAVAVVCAPDRGYPAYAERGEAARVAGMAGIVEETLERWFGSLAPAPAVIDRARETLRAMAPESWAATWRAFAQFDGFSALPPHISVRCVAGGADVSTPPQMVAQAARALGAGEPVVVPEAPHQLALLCPERLVEAVEWS